MGTLADKLQYLKDTKDAIMNAIIEKGVAITSSDTFRSYADKIKSITSGDKPIVYDTVSSVDKNPYDYISKDSFSDSLTSVVITSLSNLITIGSEASISNGIFSPTGYKENNLIALNYITSDIQLGVWHCIVFKCKPSGSSQYSCLYNFNRNYGMSIWNNPSGYFGANWDVSSIEAPYKDSEGWSYVTLAVKAESGNGFNIGTLKVRLFNGIVTDAENNPDNITVLSTGEYTNLSSFPTAEYGTTGYLGARVDDCMFDGEIDCSNVSYYRNGTLIDTIVTTEKLI